MPATPLILGAIPCAIFAGALIGTNIPTEPVNHTAADPLEQIPQHQVESRSLAEARNLVAPRNHYPLETPDGTVEVAELAYHGRLRDRMRDQPLYGAENEAEAFAMAEDAPESPALSAFDPPVTRSHPDAAQRLPDNFVPLEPGVFENTQPSPQPADRVAQNTTPAEGEARVIHVAQELTTQP